MIIRKKSIWRCVEEVQAWLKKDENNQIIN